jgi:hypothetical protein
MTMPVRSGDLALIRPEGTDIADDLCADGCVSVSDGAAFSGLSRSELYLQMESGQLPFVKHGKRRLIPRKALVRLLASGLRGGTDV